MNTRHPRTTARRGSSMLWMANIWLVLTVCVGAFAVDWGKYLATRAAVRDAIDAGARAASVALEEGTDPKTAALATIAQNSNGSFAVDATKVLVISGAWNGTTRTFVPGGRPANAVEVTISQPYSGGVFARPRSTIEASSIAHFQHRDIMLVLDYSGSMNQKGKANAMRKAVSDFCDVVSKEGGGRDRIAVVRYSDVATLLEPYTYDMGGVKLKTDASAVTGATNIGGGMDLALGYAEQNSRSTAQKMVVLLTDGLANRPTDRDPIQYTRDQAQRAHDLGIPVWAVSFGSDADQTLMEYVATTTSSKSYHVGDDSAKSLDDLRTVFREIAASNATHFVK